MTDVEQENQESRGAEKFLGVTTVVLFACLLAVTIVRLVVGWRNGPWPGPWQAIGIAFALSLLMYLGSGGTETALELNRTGADQKLSVAAVVGRIGAALLFLAFVGNLAGAFWEESRPIALIIVRDSIGGGFAVCFIVYLALRVAGRCRAQVAKSSFGGDSAKE